MASSWLIVKWAVLVVGLACVALLAAVTVWHRGFYRERLSRKLLMGVVIGNFLLTSFAGLFENIEFKRVCFVVGGLVYAGVATVLARYLAQSKKTTPLRVNS